MTDHQHRFPIPSDGEEPPRPCRICGMPWDEAGATNTRTADPAVEQARQRAAELFTASADENWLRIDMTVGELIAELRDFPEYLPVMLSSDGMEFRPVGDVEYMSADRDARHADTRY